MAPGAGICTSEMGAAIGSRTAPKGCAVLAQPYVLQKQWWGAAMGSRTAPKGGSAPEPPLPILLLLCDAFANYTFWHNKYELSLTIDIGLLHLYHLSVLPPKQHTIPLIVSRQISIANVSPNLTDDHIEMEREPKEKFYRSK